MKNICGHVEPTIFLPPRPTHSLMIITSHTPTHTHTQDDSLIGYPKRKEEGAPKEHGQAVVKIDLIKDTSQDASGFCNSRALGMIRYTHTHI